MQKTWKPLISSLRFKIWKTWAPTLQKSSWQLCEKITSFYQRLSLMKGNRQGLAKRNKFSGSLTIWRALVCGQVRWICRLSHRVSASSPGICGDVFLGLKTGEQDANAEAAFIAVFLFLFSAPECLRSTLWFKNVPFKCPPKNFPVNLSHQNAVQICVEACLMPSLKGC